VSLLVGKSNIHVISSVNVHLNCLSLLPLLITKPVVIRCISDIPLVSVEVTDICVFMSSVCSDVAVLLHC